jgi:hypothetical protein
VDGGVVGNSETYSMAGDLPRWLENFENPRVGTPEVFAAMQKPTVLRTGEYSHRAWVSARTNIEVFRRWTTAAVTTESRQR